MKSHKQTSIVLYISIGLFLLLSCIFQLYLFRKDTQLIIEQTFLQTIDKDLFERLNSPKVNPIKVVVVNKIIPETKNGIRFQSSSQDTIIPYTQDLTREKIHLDNRYMHHTATRTLNPINPGLLEKRFTSLLDSIGIKAQTGITYYDKKEGKRYHSNSNMYVYSSSFHSTIIPLGLEKEMEIQAFVYFTPSYWCQPIGRHILYNFIFLGLFILYSIDSYFAFSKRIITKFNLQKEKTPQIILLPDGNYQIGTIHLNTQDGIITTLKQTTNISKRQEYILLKAFLQAPNFQLSREDIYSLLKKVDEKYSNQVNAIISRLRKLLEDDPNIKIELIDEKVYQIFI